ncbi:UNVERIFIED_CONTAM: hypothetical protein Sindi_2504800 [Sesamum indicum]
MFTRRFKDKKEAVEPEADPERDQRTVFAYQTDPEFDLDIRDDVQEECSKYGRVKHIHVDKNSAGYVYLRFESVEAASRAQQAMHKRWFARRLISAIFLIQVSTEIWLMYHERSHIDGTSLMDEINLTSMMPNSKAQPERGLLQTKHERSVAPLPGNDSASSWIVWKSLAVV